VILPVTSVSMATKSGHGTNSFYCSHCPFVEWLSHEDSVAMRRGTQIPESYAVRNKAVRKLLQFGLSLHQSQSPTPQIPAFQSPNPYPWLVEWVLEAIQAGVESGCPPLRRHKSPCPPTQSFSLACQEAAAHSTGELPPALGPSQAKRLAAPPWSDEDNQAQRVKS
jgi:hypothetical protein